MGESSFGKYRLIAELGHGGMADVFLAVQAGPVGSGFRKLTVVKRLRQNLAEEPEFVAMLVDEARIAARLNHPNVVQTNEVGEYNGQYFISMEYLDGQPFHRIQHRSGQRAKEGLPAPFDRDQQLIVLMDTLSGLHHAHELADFDGTSLQIVHRDMTPHNIFVTYEGQVKVVDFGIAKAAGRSSETRQGIVKGKVRYMAPEQAIGQAVDRRADIFSVGVMLWECVTGRRLWSAMDDMQIVQALVSGNFPRAPRDVVPEIDAALDAICSKALAQRADDRYATADDLRADIEQYLAETGTLVAARRKMPAALIELFRDKRTEIKAVIEKQLAALDFRVTGDFAPVALPIASSASPISRTIASGGTGSQLVESTGLANGVAARSTVPVPVASQEENASSLDTPQERRAPARRMLPVALGVAAAAALAVTVAFGLRNSSATVKTPEIEEISLRVATSPPSSRISIDDSPARPAPLDAKVARDGREHRLHIEADGYVAKTEVVTFARDVAMSIDLVKAVASAAPVASATAPEKPRPPTNTGAAAWRPPPVVAPVKTVEPVVPVASVTAPPVPTAPEKKAGKLGLDKTDPWGSGGK